MTVTAKSNNKSTPSISHTVIATTVNVKQRLLSCALTNYSRVSVLLILLLNYCNNCSLSLEPNELLRCWGKNQIPLAFQSKYTNHSKQLIEKKLMLSFGCVHWRFYNQIIHLYFLGPWSIWLWPQTDSIRVILVFLHAESNMPLQLQKQFYSSAPHILASHLDLSEFRSPTAEPVGSDSGAEHCATANAELRLYFSTVTAWS